jgi:hypothetical protein
MGSAIHSEQVGVARTKRRWFGGLGPEFGVAPPWLQKLRVTAIAVPYSPFGFVIAADGRQRWGHQPSRDALIRASESDKVIGFRDHVCQGGEDPRPDQQSPKGARAAPSLPSAGPTTSAS